MPNWWDEYSDAPARPVAGPQSPQESDAVIERAKQPGSVLNPINGALFIDALKMWSASGRGDCGKTLGIIRGIPAKLRDEFLVQAAKNVGVAEEAAASEAGCKDGQAIVRLIGAGDNGGEDEFINKLVEIYQNAFASSGRYRRAVRRNPNGHAFYHNYGLHRRPTVRCVSRRERNYW